MILFEIIFDVILFNFGVILLKLLTLNKYPPKDITEKERVFISLFGAFSVVLFVVVILYT